MRSSMEPITLEMFQLDFYFKLSMKKILFLTLAFFALYPVFSQKKSKVKEVPGALYKPKKSDRSYTFNNAIKYGDYYYAIGKKYDYEYHNYIFWYFSSLKNSDFLIYKLDAKMNVKAVIPLPAEFNNKFVNSITINRFGDNLCAFFYFNNKKQLKQYLFAQMIDIRTLKPIGKPYKVAETAITKKEKKIGLIFRYSITSDYQKLMINADKSNVWRSRRERKAAAKQKNHTLTYWLIDKDFKLINSGKNVKLGKGNTVILGHAFDTAGNMCFLGFEEGSGTKKGKKLFGDVDSDGDDNTSKMVMKIIKRDGSSTDMSFAEGEYFYSAKLKVNPNTGNVAVIGLLGSKRYGAKGIFSQQVNLSTAEVLSENKELFGTELVKKLESLSPPPKEKAGSRNVKTKEKPNKKTDTKKTTKKDVKDYIYQLVNLGDIHYNDSNELVAVTQKFYIYTVTYTTTDGKGNRTTHTETHYVYGDIIGFKLSPEGKIENFGYLFHKLDWVFPIERDYKSIYTNDKLFIINRNGWCQMKLDNSVSKMTPIKTPEFRGRRYVMSEYIDVDDTEMIYVRLHKRKVIFTLVSIKLE